MSWPAFIPNQLIVGNLDSNVAILCGWTKREFLRDRMLQIDPDAMSKIAAIGQLYTAERGIDMLMRNLIANPQIDTIIVHGKDISRASTAFTLFMLNKQPLLVKTTGSGTTYTTTDGNSKARIWGDIPHAVIDRVRNTVKVIAPVQDIDVTELLGYVDDHFNPLKDNCGEGMLYPPPRPEVDLFPAPDSVQVLRAKTVGEGWLELLHYITTFGKRVPTHYDMDTLEIMDLVVVITDQSPYEHMTSIPTYLPFSAEKVAAYCKRLISPDKDPDVTYTYGNLMRAHFCKDQLMEAAEKLAKDRGSRSVVISLWDPNNPMKGSPCLNHIWFRIIEDTLHMTATIRSNDMYLGWPENAYGLRYLQDWVRCMVLKLEGCCQDDSGLVMGDTVIVSQSAHLYEDCWAPAKEVLSEHRRYKEWWDEKGQWIIESIAMEGCTYVEAVLQSPEGDILFRTQGTPGRVRRDIAEMGLVSDIGHALYVGQMIENAARGGKSKL
jgi:thymidylate synthase